MKRIDVTDALVLYFEERVKWGRDDECWTWVGARFAGGYGQVRLNDSYFYAHRVAYAIAYPDFDQDLIVRHYTCNNRLCVNPQHLRAGTQLDNIQDRQDQGRQAKGVQHGKSKLTPEQVLLIRAAIAGGGTQRRVAADFGVDRGTVRAIIDGRSWTHVT